MRNRIKNYTIVTPDSQNIDITFQISDKVYNTLTTISGSAIILDATSFRQVVEAIRLIADETRGYNLCMTGQKAVFTEARKSNMAGYNFVTIRTNRALLTEIAGDDEDDIAAIEALTRSDQFTIEVDWGDDMEDLQKAILGEPQGISCPDGIPACNMGDFGFDVLTGDYDYFIEPNSITSLPDGFGIGSIVRNTGMVNPESYSIAVAVNNPVLAYYDGHLYFQSGVTWIEMPVDKAYICTQAIEVTCDDVEGEPFTGILYVYQEAKPENLQDVYNLIKNSLGTQVLATESEYSAFKSHVATEIANILTPITEEE